MHFIYYAWLLHPFQENDEQIHKVRRVYVECVESVLINLMKERFEDAVFNKRANSRVSPECKL